MHGAKITRISFSIALALVFLMWSVFALDYTLDLGWYKFGVYPRKSEGLIGILFSPFLHSTQDFGHIFNNTLPTLILTWLLFYHYRKIAAPVFILLFFLAGIGTWLLGKPSYHIGMSGVIYALTSFLVISGFFRKNMRVAAVSLFVLFLYGSIVWGIFPIKVGVSWEGHLSGFIAGIMVAFVYKERGPQPPKLRYEMEEELGIEPELEYWRADFVPPQKEQEEGAQNPPAPPKVVYRYTFVPKEEAKGEEEE